MTRRSLVIFLIGFILFGANEVMAQAYPGKGSAIPHQLVLKILPKPGGANGEINFEGVIKVRAGTLAKGEVTFQSSPDLEVVSASTTVENITENNEKSFPIVVKKKAGVKPVFGTWIRFRVVYHYDFKALEKLAKDETLYPSPLLRSRILEKIAKLRTTKSEDIIEAEYMFPPVGTPKNK